MYDWGDALERGEGRDPFVSRGFATVLDSGFTTKPYYTCDGLVVKPDI